MRRVVIALCVTAVVAGNASADNFFTAIFGGSSAPEKGPKLPSGTHETAKTIAVKSDIKGIKLQTLASGADGQVYALLGSDRYGSKVDAGEVQVYDAAGQKVKSWKVGFQGQAINCAPDGSIYVAGNGRLAVYTPEGAVKMEAELPFIKSVVSDEEKLKKKAAEQQKSSIESYEEILKESKSQLDELRKKDADKLSKAEQAQMKQHEQMVKAYTQMLEQEKKKKPEAYVDQIVSRVKIINSVAVTEKDVFVVCGELTGYGFAVWRTDRDLSNPKQVMSQLRGCCGQMDVQAAGDDLIVALNCEHGVGRYTREGKKVAKFGKRGRETEPDCFGGCCNPMNVRVGAGGRVYTAESEGIVRAFSAEGKPEGVIGSVKISGGCKNVAIAASPDGNTVWFCDQPGSKIHVLVRKAEAAKGD